MCVLNCTSSYQILPRVLRDVSACSTETTILGRRIAFPVCVAPTAFLCTAHPDGEVATAKGDAQYQIRFCARLTRLADNAVHYLTVANVDVYRVLRDLLKTRFCKVVSFYPSFYLSGLRVFCYFFVYVC